MSTSMQYKKGERVTFVGFSSDKKEDLPDNAESLEEDREYDIIEVTPESGDQEGGYTLGVSNPKFNPEKRKTKNNKPYLHGVDVWVWADEIAETVQDSEEGGEEGEAESGDDIDADDVVVDGIYTITDQDGPVTGRCFKKTKTIIGLIEDDGEGNEDEVEFSIKEIDLIDEVEAAEPEPEVEEKPKAKTKRKTKTKVDTKAKTETKAKTTRKTKTKVDTKAKTKAKTTTAVKGSEDKTPGREVKGEEMKGLLVLEDSEQDAELVGMIEDADGGVIGLVDDLAEESGGTDYRLGGALYNAWIDGEYKDVDDGEYDGEKGFERYVVDHVGLGYRKACYLMNVYANFRKHGVDSDVVSEIGWSKAAKIAEVLTEENKDELVEMAKESTVLEITDNIKEMKSRKGTDTRVVIKKTRFKFALVEDQGEVIRGYLEQAAESLSLTSMDECFAHIVTEWAQANLDVSATAGKKQARRLGRK